MKVHRMRYISYIGMSCGTPCSTTLSIGVVSARGSIKISNNQELVNPDVLEAAHNMMVLGPAKGR